MSSKVLEIFSKLQDPRRNSGYLLYPLNEVIFLVICGVLCGSEDWANISEFGKSQISWLRKYLPYENGIPSHDTLGRIFGLLDSSGFEACFISWVNSLDMLTSDGVISIDGKRVCNSYDTDSDKAAIHLVSAFASASRICLGQVATQDKSNEITAIPLLLDMLMLDDCVVTIDAMGCQREIVKKIVSHGADYVIALKSNQEELFEEVKQAFKVIPVHQTDNQVDSGHGRIERRTCEVISDLRFVDESTKWVGLKSIAKIEAERIDKVSLKKTVETRYYISSLAHATTINNAVRSHWSIENSLHWVLDVRFNEDGERKRKGQSPYNFSFITKAIINLIKLDKSKGSIKTKRLKAAWDYAFREQILKI